MKESSYAKSLSLLPSPRDLVVILRTLNGGLANGMESGTQRAESEARNEQQDDSQQWWTQ